MTPFDLASRLKLKARKIGKESLEFSRYSMITDTELFERADLGDTLCGHGKHVPCFSGTVRIQLQLLRKGLVNPTEQLGA